MEKQSLIALETVLLILAAGTVYAGMNASDWPMPYYNALHTSHTKAPSSCNISEILLLQAFEASGHVSTPVAADANGDGKAEVFFSAGTKVYALDSDFEVLWVKNHSCQPTAPGLYDLFADGKIEVLYGCGDGIHVLYSEGGSAWDYQTMGSVAYPPIAANLDMNKELEVVAASEDKSIYVLDANGSLLRDYNIPDSGFTMPAVGDVNSDKLSEIVVGSRDNKVYVISYSKGDVMVFDTQGHASTPIVVPMNRTKTYRIGLGTGDGHLFSLYYSTYTKGSQRRCDDSGCYQEPIKVSKLAVSWEFQGGYEAVASPAVADLNNDRECEYIIGTSDKTLYILGSTGSVLKKHSVNGKITSTPAVADLNGDKRPEIVYGSSDGTVQILASNGSRIWDYHSEDSVTESPGVSDLDRDGRLEILLSTGDKLLLFGDNSIEPEKIAVNGSANNTLANVTSTSSTSTTITTTTTMLCGKEGGVIDPLYAGGVDICCAGLSALNWSSVGINRSCELIDRIHNICTYCGNGVCGLGENYCNCPRDCETLSTTSTTLPAVTAATFIEAANGTGNNSSKTLSDATFLGQPLSTVIAVGLGVFIVFQLFLVLMMYLIPRIIQRKIDRIRSEITGYKSDLTSLERAGKR